MSKRKRTKTQSKSTLGSLFGNDEGTTNGDETSTSNLLAFDLFSSNKVNKFNELSKKRIHYNTASMKELHKEDQVTHFTSQQTDPIDIIQMREKRNASEKAIMKIRSITISIPSIICNNTSTNDDDTDVKDGILRTFVRRCKSIYLENGVLIIKSDINSNSVSKNISTRTTVQNSDSLIPYNLLSSMAAEAKLVENDVCSQLKIKGNVWQLSDDDPTTSHHNSHTNNIEETHAFKYHEVASRCLGRLDIRYRMNTLPFSHPHVISNQYILPIVQSLLGGTSAKLLYAGLILSFPGSANQPWHQDGSALFEKHEFGDDNDYSKSIVLPPYAMNVFIPLHDVTEEFGPTEFVIGSHSKISNDVVDCLNKNDSTLGNGSSMESDEVIGPNLQMGDVLIYDYRICHRGTSNLTSYNTSSNRKTRSMLYLMYGRPWFHEHLNFGDTHLFDQV